MRQRECTGVALSLQDGREDAVGLGCLLAVGDQSAGSRPITFVARQPNIRSAAALT